jgi:hypothetical protein
VCKQPFAFSEWRRDYDFVLAIEKEDAFILILMEDRFDVAQVLF